MKRSRPQLRTPNEPNRAPEKPVPRQQALAGGDPGPGVGRPFSQDQLGQDLRAARKSAGLTLVALSRSSGYSITHLSQVERGHACPTMGALLRITRAIGADVHMFLEPNFKGMVSLVERGQHGTRGALGGARPLTNGIAGGRLEAFAVVLDGKGAPPAILQETCCARHVHVLAGQLLVRHHSLAVVGEPGDSFYVAEGVDCTLGSQRGAACTLLVLRVNPGSGHC